MSYTVNRPTWPPSATAFSTRRELYLRKNWSTLCKNSKAEHQMWSYRYWSTPTCVFFGNQVSKEEYDSKLKDAYRYEVAGGLHSYTAKKELAEEYPQNRFYKTVEASVYAGLTEEQAPSMQCVFVCVCVWVCGVHIWSRKIHLLILVVRRYTSKYYRVMQINYCCDHRLLHVSGLLSKLVSVLMYKKLCVVELCSNSACVGFIQIPKKCSNWF